MPKSCKDKEILPEKRSMRQRLADAFRRLWRWCLRREPDTTLRDAIEELIEEDSEGESSIGTDERLLLNNVLSLKDLTAEDVMIPYANIIAVPFSAKPEEIMETFMKAGVSQVPVYSGTIDNVIGGLSIKDVLTWANTRPGANVKEFLQDVPFIAPTMRTLDLLLQMRESGMRMAIVVDEYGGVEGLVTFAALIEEIIGDIQYAQDHGDNNPIEIQSNGCIILNASTTLEELDEFLERVCEKKINWLKGFENEDIDTVGGMIALLTGRVPLRGELIVYPDGGPEFEILDADPRRIKKVAIRNVIHGGTVPLDREALPISEAVR